MSIRARNDFVVRVRMRRLVKKQPTSGAEQDNVQSSNQKQEPKDPVTFVLEDTISSIRIGYTDSGCGFGCGSIYDPNLDDY